MHLRAHEDISVEIADLDLQVAVKRGETVFTEISRKFTKRDCRGNGCPGRTAHRELVYGPEGMVRAGGDEKEIT